MARPKEAPETVAFVDLFCGCGGLSLGLKRAGLKPVGAYDRMGQEVDCYNLNVAPVARRADIKDLCDKDIEGATMLVASPPCPPFSEAAHAGGKGRGVSHPSGLLVDEVHRLAQPAFIKTVLIENVDGLLREPAWVALFREGLERQGYTVFHFCLNAKDWGLPQDRGHVFFVGFREAPAARAWSPPTPALFQRPAVFGDIMDGSGARPVTGRNLRYLLERARQNGAKGFGYISLTVVEPGGVMGTVTTRAPHALWVWGVVWDGERLRYPTFLEAARAQGFPDRWQWPEAEGAKWRMAGNAVPPPLGQAVGNAVREALRQANQGGKQ